ncbi:phage tail protein [Gelidibacter algens]|nr:fibronectin type III domain-containing protein [Gelidibacter algens]
MLLTASVPVAHAQLYPVQVNQSIIPPYNTQLNSYATASSVKLRLYLTMTDVNINNRQVRLKLKIKGHGLNIQSTDFVQGAPQIFLNGGMQQQLTNIDLAPYFELNNFLGISPQQYNRPLPDGTYKFCWEVYDFLTGQLISSPNMGCDTIFLLLNDPPFLNLPNRGDQLTDIQPTNIIFQWTPRHANATNVSYEFELRELWDRQINPQAGFMASPNYYTETTYATTLLYTISKPTLLPGHTYAWRVRAKSTTGISENSVFKNNGYSEIFHFTYTNTCYPPSFVLAEPLNKGIVKINWQTNPDHKKYHIQYKRADVSNAEWFEVYSYGNQAQISNLQAGVTYNFRVGGTCNALIDFDQVYSYSSINQFTTPTADESVSYSCGIVPEMKITNSKPLVNIGVNETFTAGDFPVTVKEIEGGNGIFSGKGYIVVPYLADTKIAVTFSGIRINTDYQLFDGIIKTTYDRAWGGVADVDDLFNGNPGQQNTRAVNFPIGEIIIDPNGDILVVGVGGSPIVEYAGGEDYIITDSGHPGDPNGTPPIAASPPKKYHVDEKGTITPIGEQAAGGSSTVQNTNGVNKKGEATTISAQGLEVTFTQAPNSVYGFDAYNPSYPETKSLYKKLGSNYYIPYKSVAQGQTDYIVANLNISNDSIRPQDIVFKTKDGVAIAKVDSTGTNKITSYTLKLTGLATDANVETQAVIKQGNTYKIAGAFIQYQATSKDVNVVLVNTAKNVNIQEVKNKLITIYKRAMVNLSITEINDFEKDLNELASTGTIDSGESGFLANYTPQQQAINSKIKSRSDYNTTAYYLILTDKKPSTTGQKGLMPLGKQFGYIYTGNATPSGAGGISAHELGHGAFQLKHPFSTHSYGFKEVSTDWLMDYANGEHIPYEHWKEIHNPKLRIGLFDGDHEAEHNKNAHLALTKSGKIIDEFYLDGKQIKVSVLIATNNYTIEEIKYEGLIYSWVTSKEAFINGEKEITVKKASKTIDKVNLFRSRGDGCTYDYVLINWGSDDEKTTHVNERIEEKIKNFKENDWKLTPLNVRDASCNNAFIKELLARDQRDCSDAELKNGAEELRMNLQVSDGQKVTAAVNNTCLSAIRNLVYTEIEILLNTIAQQSEIKEYSEVAILRLMNAIKSDDYIYFYEYLEKEDNKILKKLVSEIDDASIYFFTDKKNYSNFIGAVTEMVKPLSDEFKWKYMNLLINQRYSKIDVREQESISILLKNLKQDKLENPNEVSFFIEMLKFSPNLINILDYKSIYLLAKTRSKNETIFNQFTQTIKRVEKTSKTTPITFTAVEVNGDPDWFSPKSMTNSLQSNGSFIGSKIFNQKELVGFFEWVTFLYSSQGQSVLKLLNSKNPEDLKTVLIKFEEQLLLYTDKKIADDKDYWNGVTTVTCDNITDILDRIRLNESKTSLQKVNFATRVSIIENIITCQAREAVNVENTEEALFKVLRSFDEDDSNILKELEKIGFNNIYKNFSGLRLKKFCFWTASQITSSAHFSTAQSEKLFLKNNDLITNTNELIQLEQDVLQFKNTSFKTNSKTTFIVTGFGELGYNEMVPVYIAGSFKYLDEDEFKKGTVAYMPLIQFIAMSNDNTNVVFEKSAWAALDGVLLVIGIGEFKYIYKVGNGVHKTIALLEIAGNATSATAQLLNNDYISDDFRFSLQMASLAMNIPRLLTKMPNAEIQAERLLAKLEKEASLNDKFSYSDYIKNIFKYKPSASSLLEKLKSLPVLNGKVKKLGTLESKFMEDFANAGDDILKEMNKADSELFSGWKNFRKKYFDEILCD